VSCSGDLCDLETVVFEDFKFEEVGEYKIAISHNEKGYKIPGIIEVGLIIDKKDYNNKNYENDDLQTTWWRLRSTIHSKYV
jgi:hypothetical protein